MIRRTPDDSTSTEELVPADTPSSEAKTPIQIICDALKERDVAGIIDVCIGTYKNKDESDKAMVYLVLARMKNAKYCIYQFREVERIVGRNIRRILYVNEVMVYDAKPDNMSASKYIETMFNRYCEHVRVNKLNRTGKNSVLYESLLRSIFDGTEDPLILELYKDQYLTFKLLPMTMDDPEGFISDITHMYPAAIETQRE